MARGHFTDLTVALLEATGSDNPQLLAYLLRVMASSHTERLALGALEVTWDVDTHELAPFILRTLATLDTLERRRGAKPRASLALLQLALARTQRVTAAARRRRLARLCRRIRYQAKVRAESIRAFLHRPPGPVNLANWLPEPLPSPHGPVAS